MCDISFDKQDARYEKNKQNRQIVIKQSIKDDPEFAKNYHLMDDETISKEQYNKLSDWIEDYIQEQIKYLEEEELYMSDPYKYYGLNKGDF